ncbi:iron export ABC transporter permease subunit FetB [Macrococcus psychrotolerans]|uniref:Iron export ABC transporter permease subunit FetB n=1 Tax=Macrococcus psychrotolerans TaxID=3039389 RepID=A0AAT9P541_9STAP|nr:MULTISPECIES: iron export ABC transporter permease subunit FetB [Macrococcus]QYA33404.1 iron export ABC transporter permease subunit FetB [Macrococcus sp. 19Msa1099]QYA38220.1 iron export ABC transporter permease subunit FetB [Macrococcus caseolyticus]QYA76927.1 iron export ABC transporter permease subunit FetB [Macrococcus caseolyticus]
MTLFQISLAFIFVIIPLVMSAVLKLGLEKDVIIAAVRSTIQLMIVGYILTFVFEGNHPIYMFLMILLMIVAATQNIIKKGQGIRGITWKIVLTLIVVEVLTIGILTGFRIIPFEPRYVIPISGMMIGNAMVLSLLFLNRFLSELDQNDEQIELILSLGGTPKQAIHRVLMTSIKNSMIPTIESTKTMGLVQLPGMMSGQIIGGADPLVAAQLQLIIIFLLMTAATLSSVLVGFLSYPTLFNDREQYIGKYSKS